MARVLIQVARLPSERRRLLLMALVLQMGARVVLSLAGLPRAVAIATWSGGRCSRCLDVEAIGWALGASATRTGGTCLTQALAARVLYGWSGRQSRLVIGVRQSSGTREFHAWTEVNDVHVPSATDAARFAPLTVWS